MRHRISDSVPRCIPAAQYVRMSDDGQQFSIENQKAAIHDYAERNGYNIVKTYVDAGKSGIVLKHREALRQLLQDVLNGNAGYKAILVYDVSRWGRFPNNDEGATEFVCTQAGIPLHYCAESFVNDGTPSSSLLKALKRSMAAEYSRELSDKVFRGKCRLVQMGYWVGGQAGYGYRRMMISADGKRKQMMKLGECKSLVTDRVILVPGSRQEIECVRHMFSMVMARRRTRSGRNSPRSEPKRVHDVWETVAGCDHQEHIDEPEVCWPQCLVSTLSAPSRETPSRKT